VLISWWPCASISSGDVFVDCWAFLESPSPFEVVSIWPNNGTLEEEVKRSSFIEIKESVDVAFCAVWSHTRRLVCSVIRTSGRASGAWHSRIDSTTPTSSLARCFHTNYSIWMVQHDRLIRGPEIQTRHPRASRIGQADVRCRSVV